MVILTGNLSLIRSVLVLQRKMDIIVLKMTAADFGDDFAKNLPFALCNRSYSSSSFTHLSYSITTSV